MVIPRVSINVEDPRWCDLNQGTCSIFVQPGKSVCQGPVARDTKCFTRDLSPCESIGVSNVRHLCLVFVTVFCRVVFSGLNLLHDARDGSIVRDSHSTVRYNGIAAVL